MNSNDEEMPELELLDASIQEKKTPNFTNSVVIASVSVKTPSRKRPLDSNCKTKQGSENVKVVCPCKIEQR